MGEIYEICSRRAKGEVVKMLFLIELSDLNGREVLKDYDVDSVVQFEGK